MARELEVYVTSAPLCPLSNCARPDALVAREDPTTPGHPIGCRVFGVAAFVLAGAPLRGEDRFDVSQGAMNAAAGR
jgi:hypothetical protein